MELVSGFLFEQPIARYHGDETKSRASKLRTLDDLVPSSISSVTVSSFNMA